MVKVVAIAEQWRKEDGYVGRGGVVIIFDGEVQGWSNELRNPENWRPGCYAVDEENRVWKSIFGDDQRGALMWLDMENA